HPTEPTTIVEGQAEAAFQESSVSGDKPAEAFMKSIISVQNAWNKSLIHDVLVRMSAASNLSVSFSSE
ncbi:unnamed protein product, partial [Pylaiella littoralis]